MKWGIDAAEQLGQPMYLESTEGGVPLYESVGFQRIEDERLVHKAEVLGTENDVEVPLMRRDPRKA